VQRTTRRTDYLHLGRLPAHSRPCVLSLPPHLPHHLPTCLPPGFSPPTTWLRGSSPRAMDSVATTLATFAWTLVAVNTNHHTHPSAASSPPLQYNTLMARTRVLRQHAINLPISLAHLPLHYHAHTRLCAGGRPCGAPDGTNYVRLPACAHRLDWTCNARASRSQNVRFTACRAHGATAAPPCPRHLLPVIPLVSSPMSVCLLPYALRRCSPELWPSFHLVSHVPGFATGWTRGRHGNNLPHLI